MTIHARTLCMISGCLLILSDADSALAACLPGGNSATISTALQANNKAELCPSAVFTADQVIILGAGQQIFTSGYPEIESLKALITVPTNVTYNEPVIQAYAASSFARSAIYA